MIQEPTKKCCRCQEIKPVSEFYKGNPKKNDGYHYKCKICLNAYNRNYYNNVLTPEERKVLIKKSYERNGATRLVKAKIQRLQDPTYSRLANQKSYRKHKDKKRKYFLANKDKIYDYRKNKLETDINFKISCTYRTRIWEALKNNKKFGDLEELLGCTIEELKIHLSKQFQSGMTLDNYGEWHIDHIIPCSFFNQKDYTEQKICFHYSNLQPLWAKDNLSKGDRVIRNLGISS